MASNKGARSASAPTDDSDLEDLIAKKPVGRQPQVASSANASPLGFISGVISLCCYKFPCCSKCVLALMFLGFIAFLSNALFNPAQKMGIMGADYSAITSAYDLSLSKVDHWCIQGDNDSCKCEDPLEPNSRSEFKSWNAAHKANVKDVNLYRAVYGSDPTLIDEETGKPRPPIDVAFLGESVVEAMDGRWLGKRVVRSINTVNGREGPDARKKPDIGKVFERLFRKEKGGPVEGVALGVAGDNTANVLWRLQHDEMPYDFNPKVWWLVLGMNDLTRMQCSEEIVVLGVLRVVEEIKLRKPDAHIVINSLLPMINYQRPAQPKMADFADFKRDKDGMRENMEIEKAKKEYMQKKGGKGRNLRERSRSRKHTKKTKKQRQEDEENASEGPDLEKALERRKKILEARDKRVKDKVFKDNEKYRPKKPISPFLPMIKKKVMPPVWPSVHLINDKLKEFCTKHDTITFFDATPIFAASEGGGKHRLHNELISPRGHPSEMGFAVWEGNIMGRLHKLLMDKEERKPDPPPAADDTDDKESEEDPGAEVLEPVHETKASGDDVSGDGESGDGVEHVSEGKESDPPKVAQPKRAEEQPKSEEVDEDSSDEIEADKDNKGKKAKGSSAKENVEVESDKEEGDNSGDEEDEEEEVTKKMRKKKTEEKEDEEEPEEDEEDGDDEDGDDDEEEEDDEEE